MEVGICYTCPQIPTPMFTHPLDTYPLGFTLPPGFLSPRCPVCLWVYQPLGIPNHWVYPPLIHTPEGTWDQRYLQPRKGHVTTREQTDTYENMTFPQLSWRAAINN